MIIKPENRKTKYQNAKVKKESGIPTPIIKLHNLGSKRWLDAIIAAVIIGAIADSKKEISIISPRCFKIKK